jgi:hypothetical protein
MHSLVVADLDARGGLAVRPDALLVAASALVEGAGPVRSIRALKDAAKIVASHLVELHPQAEILPRRLHLGGANADKAAKVERSDAQFDATIRLPLAEALDVWSRAELAAEVCEALARASVDLAKRKPAVKLGWREPTARVRDAAAYRVQLLESYNADLQRLTSGVALGGTFLPVDASLEVHQHEVSLEEVRLALGPWELRRAR